MNSLNSQNSHNQPIENETPIQFEPTKEDAEEKQLPKIQFFFPWLSLSSAFIFILFLFWNSSQFLQQYFLVDPVFSTLRVKLLYLIGFLLLLLIDVRFYFAYRRRLKSKFEELKNHLELIWQRKKIQQQKANTYSGHTERLKNFISDKLLEFVEYDAKFLHFKGIAAEVRHNGVISYDKVTTALYRAIEQQKFLSIYEQSESGDSEQSINSLSDYQDAIDAMRYLWDLLDLSTADNMAIHIGNQLIECEEHYYQLHLDSEKQLEVTQSIPKSPTFHPQLAVLMTVSLLSNDTEVRKLISLSRINETVLKEQFIFENEQLRIDLSDTPELLGNPNHIILLLENLIKNAQFFSQKCRYKQSSDRIIIRLKPGDGFAHFTIYNRGPHIEEDKLQQIFKLGYSTRRTKQHHGKGLGLFFSKEIVSGYQGVIQVSNVNAPSSQYQVTLILTKGESRTYTLICELQDERMQVRVDDAVDWKKEVSLSSNIPIASLEVTSNHNGKTYQIDNIEQELQWLEPCAFSPAWQINVKASRKQYSVVFKPLDINGVRFDIKLPTAESCLNEQVLNFEESDID